MLKRALLLLAFVLVFAPWAAAQGPDLAKLDAQFAQALKDWNVPGMSVAIVKDGKVVLAKGYGVREMGKADPVDAGHAVRDRVEHEGVHRHAWSACWSTRRSSGGTTACSSYLPWFQLYDPYVSQDMRVRDLLSHRSGLGTFSGDLLWYGTPYSREEVIRRARFLKQAAPFRARYGYQNIMFVAGGEVAAAAGGQSWDALVKARIFDRLGMTRTVTTFADVTHATNIATPHASAFTPLPAVPVVLLGRLRPGGQHRVERERHGEVDRVHLNGGTAGGTRLLSEAAQRTMWTTHIALRSIRTRPCRRRRWRRRCGCPSISAATAWAFRCPTTATASSRSTAARPTACFRTSRWCRRSRLGFVILTNSDSGISSALSYMILDAFLGGDGRDWSRLFLDGRRRRRSRSAQARTRREGAGAGHEAVAATRDSTRARYVSTMYGDAVVALENGWLVLRLVSQPGHGGGPHALALRHVHHHMAPAFPWFGDGRAQFLLDPDAG